MLRNYEVDRVKIQLDEKQTAAKFNCYFLRAGITLPTIL